MNWEAYLDELQQLGISLCPEGEDLLVEGPTDALTPAHLETLKSNKQNLLHFLHHATIRYPLSSGQQGLWFEHQMMPEGFAYNTSLPLRIHSAIDPDLLQQAFQLLINRHAVLRTSFPLTEGEPIQQVKYFQEVQLEQIDASQCSELELKAKVRAAHERCFDLTTPPLFRLSLFSRRADDHVLLFTVHHLIFDGWSNWRLFDEFCAVLNALVSDQAVELPTLKTSYRDYVVWQTSVLREKEEQLLAYWKERLAGNLPLLNLPTDRPRPSVRSHRGASLPLEIPHLLSAQLVRLARNQGTTLYMVVLAAFQVLLLRYTGQHDILVGSPMAGQRRSEFSAIVGYFVNPLVMRAQFSADSSFLEFLEQVRQTVLGALEHQDMPFPLLVQRLRPDRVAGVSQIFQVMFSLVQAQTDGQLIEAAAFRQNKNDQGLMDIGGLRLSFFPLPQFEGQFDLSLELFDTSATLMGALKYNPDLFDPETIMAMADHFLILLEGILAHPTTPMAELPLLTKREQYQLLVEWNDTAASYPADRCVHQLFEQQVARSPEATALIFEDNKLGYRELNEAANRVAHALIARGVAPGTLVGICIERSFELLIGLLGILKAGGAYVPLDPDYPAARLTFMLEDSGVTLLLTSSTLARQLPPSQTESLLLDSQDRFAKESIANPELACEADQPVYLLYTSGSTGKPKAVQMAHCALTNLTQWQTSQSDKQLGLRTLQFAPISFDVASQECFATLCNGGTLVLIDDEVRRSPPALLDTIEKQQIGRIFLPFIALSQLAACAPNLARQATCLREVITAGEQLRVDDNLRRFFADTGARLINQYGPTESHVVTALELVGDPAHWPALPAIGLPIANTRIYILDPHLQPQPIGIPGELCIAGISLARGYLNRPELTAERFVGVDILGQHERIYRTGDLARWRRDGQIEFLGRLDHQVKLRGFRIELGEIETLLSAHPGVTEASVVVREDNPGEQQLVAYVVLNQRDPADSATLRRDLSAQLPDYMIPTAFVPLDSMPLTPNGKLDRQVLPPPELDRSAVETPYTAPRTPAERTLVSLWQEILMLVEPPGIDDDFFALGGHSLLSARLVSRIEELFDQRVPLHAFFQDPTIAGLARALGETESEPGQAVPDASTPAEDRRLLAPDLYRQLLSFVGSWRGERAASDSLIVGRHTEGSRPPLFWVFQGQQEFVQLAHYTGSDQPLYGVRSGHLVMDYNEDNIQALALDYVREIEALRPTGPLVIGGNCQGGIIALAIAQHLLRRGRHLPLTILMEWSFIAQPFAGPVGLIFGRESDIANPYLNFHNPELMWQRTWPQHRVEIISGGHGEFFREPNVQNLAKAVRRLIDSAAEIPLRFLPASGYKVAIQPLDLPDTLFPGQRLLIRAQVTNLGEVDWPGSESLNLILANQWLSQSNEPAILKDGATPLPPLPRGADATLFLLVRAPDKTGDWQLQLLVKEEGVRRGHKEYQTVGAAVRVLAAQDPGAVNRPDVLDRHGAPIIIGGTGGSDIRVLSELIQSLAVLSGSTTDQSPGSIASMGDWESLLLPYWDRPLPTEIASLYQASLAETLETHLMGHIPGTLWAWPLSSTIILPHLHRIWPEIRCIHLVRDGRDMALSSSQNQLNYLGPIALTDAEQRLPQAEGSIRLWERLNLVLADYAEAQMSSQYLRIHYEDLIQNPQRQIERLLRFLGLDADSASLAERIQPATGIARWQNQSPTWIAKIQSGGQKGLRRFGYLDQGSQQPEAVRKPPEDEAMSGLGAYERGEYGAAAEGLAPIIARAREVLPAFADSLHQQGRYSQAMDAWRQALAADGDNPGAWLGLGRSAQALNRNEEAITAFFEALKANPERPVDALSPLVELLNKEGRIADLEESMQQALDARQDDAELAALGARMQTLLGNLEAAAVLVRRVMRLRPDAPERVIPLFWRINAANGGEIAKQLSVDMLAAFPDDLDVLLVRAEISLGRERDPEYALNLCNQILAIAPQRHHTQILRGRCLMAVDRMDEAFEAYDQAIEHLGERASNALFHRARAHRKRGDLDAAVADLRRALAQNPQGHQIAMELEEVELTQTQQHRST